MDSSGHFNHIYCMKLGSAVCYHFTGEAVVAQGVFVSHSKSLSLRVMVPDFEPCSPGPERLLAANGPVSSLSLALNFRQPKT